MKVKKHELPKVFFVKHLKKGTKYTSHWTKKRCEIITIGFVDGFIEVGYIYTTRLDGRKYGVFYANPNDTLKELGILFPINLKLAI